VACGVVLGVGLSAFFVFDGFGLSVGCGRRRPYGCCACPALFSDVCCGGCGYSRRAAVLFLVALLLFPKISFATYAVLGLAEIAAVLKNLFGAMSSFSREQTFS